MDLTQMAFGVTFVYGVISFAKRVLPQLEGSVLQLVVLLVGIGATFLLAYSDFGHSQVVNGIALDKMNWGSLVALGLMLGGASTVVHQTLGGGGSVSNIGENQLPTNTPTTDTTTVV